MTSPFRKSWKKKEEESQSEATLRCDKLLTREEIIKKDLLSQEPLKPRETVLEPEIEKPAKQKSKPKDFTNPDEFDNEFHDSMTMNFMILSSKKNLT